MITSNSRLAGNGFRTFTLPPPIGVLSTGICMDLNPFREDWTSADGPCELASYCEESPTKPRTQVLVILCAWLSQLSDEDADYDLNVLDYWLARLKPLWDGEVSDTESDSNPGNAPESAQTNDRNRQTGNADKNETIVIICNRCGEENGNRYLLVCDLQSSFGDCMIFRVHICWFICGFQVLEGSTRYCGSDETERGRCTHLDCVTMSNVYTV